MGTGNKNKEVSSEPNGKKRVLRETYVALKAPVWQQAQRTQRLKTSDLCGFSWFVRIAFSVQRQSTVRRARGADTAARRDKLVLYMFPSPKASNTVGHAEAKKTSPK